MVRIELPEEGGGKNKYENSSALFSDWLKKGVMKKDETPALYFYEQNFVDRGKKMTRRGFFAALEIENPFKGNVKPHEKTLAKPKEDRLNMLRAVKANLSPVFGLFHDGEGKISGYCERLSKTKELAVSKDSEGTLHRLWAVTDEKIISLAADVLSDNQIFIADGHHRYETSWNYLQELIGKGEDTAAAAACRNVLIFLCPMQDKGLSVWPTHRVAVPPEGLEERIRANFNVLPEKEFRKFSKNSPQPLLIYKDGKFRALAIKSPEMLDNAMRDKCKAYRELGVSILHSVLLYDVLPENITYVKDEKEAVKLAENTGRIAVMVPPTPVEAIKEIALAGQTMPQKSTYFYPKVASGQVIHSVAGID